MIALNVREDQSVTADHPAAPRVSVIVVNYNGRFHLEACLHALLAHSGDDVEIILVDNASTDGSADFVETWFPTVRVLRRAVNDGYGAGNNVGAALAGGDVIVVLNPDTVVTAGWLEPLLRPLAQDEQIGLVTPKLLLLNNPQRSNAVGNDVHLTGLTLCRGMGQRQEKARETAVVSAISGAAFAIRRQLFWQLGGFDADAFLYMEDTDLSLRAQLAGYRCITTPQSIVYHDYTLRFGPHKTYYQERNRYRMLLKTFRWRTLLLLLPTLLLAELITWSFVLLRDRAQWRNKLRAYRDVKRQWWSLMRLRQQAQAQRRMPDRTLLARMTVHLAVAQTAPGPAAALAALVLAPLFWLQKQWLRLLVRW